MCWLFHWNTTVTVITLLLKKGIYQTQQRLFVKVDKITYQLLITYHHCWINKILEKEEKYE